MLESKYVNALQYNYTALKSIFPLPHIQYYSRSLPNSVTV